MHSLEMPTSVLTVNAVGNNALCNDAMSAGSKEPTSTTYLSSNPTELVNNISRNKTCAAEDGGNNTCHLKEEGQDGIKASRADSRSCGRRAGRARLC